MKIIGRGRIEQVEKNKIPSKCRKWRLVVPVEIDGLKKRKVKRVTCSKTEAKYLLDNFMDSLENGTTNEDLKFANYSQKWLNYRIKSKSYSPNTLDINKHSINRLNEIFGQFLLSQITVNMLKESLMDIQAKNDNTGRQVSNTYKRKLFSTLKLILQSAVEEGFLDNNPMNYVKLPKKDTKEKQAYTKEEYDYIINEIANMPLTGFTMAIQLVCKLGLRRAEVVALTWDNFNDQEQTLTINKAFKERSGTIGPPKSKASIRTIPISKSINDLLIKWQHIYSKYKFDNSYICCNNVGNLMHTQSLARWWNRFIDKNNKMAKENINNKIILPKISLHGLRHTNFTLIARYASPFDLQNYAGWSSIAPAQIYIHKNNEMLRKAITNANL